MLEKADKNKKFQKILTVLEHWEGLNPDEKQSFWENQENRKLLEESVWNWMVDYAYNNE